MPTQVLYFVLFSAAFFVSGCLCAWLIQEVRNRRERRGLAETMTERVNERYAAYLSLEARVSRLIEQFNRCEAELRQKLLAENAEIDRLTRAVDDHAGVRSAPAEPDECLVWMNEDTSFRSAAPGADAAAREFLEGDIQAELDQWEQKLQAVHDHKQAEIERQSATISQLTERLQNLEPLAESLRQSDAEVQSWRDRCAELERDADRELAAARAALESRQNELSQHMERCRQAEQRCSELEAELDAQVPAMRTQLDEREVAIRLLEQRCTDIEHKSAVQVSELGLRVAQLEPVLEEVHLRGEKLREWEVRFRDLEFSRRQDVERLEQRAAEAARTKDAEVAALRMQLKEREHESSARMEDLAQELDRRAKDLDELAQAQRDSTRQLLAQRDLAADQERELAEQKAEVGSLSRRLQELTGELVSTRTSMTGQRTQIGDLMKALTDANNEVQTQKATVAERDAYMQAAEQVVAGLRPVLEMLESRLQRDA